MDTNNTANGFEPIIDLIWEAEEIAPLQDIVTLYSNCGSVGCCSCSCINHNPFALRC